MSEPRWMEMLRASVDRHGGNKKAVADLLGVSRTMVSLVLSGTYDRSTNTLERAVLTKLDFVACPHLRSDITRADCDNYRTRRMPQSDPEELRHWIACGRCPVSQAAEAAVQTRRVAALVGRG